MFHDVALTKISSHFSVDDHVLSFQFFIHLQQLEIKTIPLKLWGSHSC